LSSEQAQHTVQPATAGGLVFDVMAEDVALSVVAGFSDLALPAGSTPSRKAPWRALKARIRPNDADRQQSQLRDRCRVVCESNVLRQVQNATFREQRDVESRPRQSVGIAQHRAL
jgi:hypothetical protein